MDLLAVQGTLKSLLQHRSSNASILQHSAFFIVQLSYPYMTNGKTIALTRWTFVGKVTSLLLNMISRLVITFLPRIKCLLISWLQSPSAVILEPPKIKSTTVSTVSPSISHEVMVNKELIGPGLHHRPVHADHAWPPFQRTLNSVFTAYENNNRRIRPPPDRGTLKILSRLLIT